MVNDVTARDFQYRSVQWLQGKTFERSTPVGPWLVVDDAEPGEISCEVDGDVVQKADTADLVFGPADLVAYISQIITLVPGDIIATGTPGGVGHARKPPRYLREGSELVTRVEGVGELRNTLVASGSLAGGHRNGGLTRCAIAVAGGGPGGLFFATLIRQADPSVEVTVFERNRADDTFGFGVVFSDATLAGIHAADPVLREALAEHGRHWDEIEVRLKGERIRCGGNGMAAIARRTLLALLQARGPRRRRRAAVQPRGHRVDDLADYDLVVAADGAELADPRAARRDVRRAGGGDRHRQVHLVRHRLPVRRADLRARARPARRLRRARLPDQRRASAPSSSRPTRRPGGGRDSTSSTSPSRPAPSDMETKAVPGEALRRPDRRARSCWSTTPAGATSAPGAPGAGTRGNVPCLLGDAAHTAHFSVGSGTKMAMEDAVAPRRASPTHRDDLAGRARARTRRPRQPSVREDPGRGAAEPVVVGALRALPRRVRALAVRLPLPLPQHPRRAARPARPGLRRRQPPRLGRRARGGAPGHAVRARRLVRAGPAGRACRAQAGCRSRSPATVPLTAEPQDGPWGAIVAAPRARTGCPPVFARLGELAGLGARARSWSPCTAARRSPGRCSASRPAARPAARTARRRRRPRGPARPRADRGAVRAAPTSSGFRHDQDGATHRRRGG